MLYKDFVDKITTQDDRNVFMEYTGDLSGCADSVREFYRHFNPVDVEFEYNSAAIRMIPADELDEMAELYGYLQADMIFAECNSDPIFIKDQVVFTCIHGMTAPRFEKLADSFDEYLGAIVDEIGKEKD